jgi:ribosomal protein L21
MYAVIKTGGKQYRVQAGDLLVVEKLEGEPGANVAFGDVLMLGDGETITLGAPIVLNARARNLKLEEAATAKAALAAERAAAPAAKTTAPKVAAAPKAEAAEKKAAAPKKAAAKKPDAE